MTTSPPAEAPTPQPLQRLTLQQARDALLAIAARSPHLVSADEVADILGDEGELVNFLCAQLTGLGVVKIGPGNLHGDSDGAILLTALLGYIAERYFMIGQESARVKTGCALRATLPGGTVVLLPPGTEISTVDKPDPIANAMAEDMRAFSTGVHWDDGGGDPIRDIKMATAPIEARCGARHCHDTGYWQVVCTCTRGPGHVADYHEDASVPVRWSAVAAESTPPVTAPIAAPVEKKAQR